MTTTRVTIAVEGPVDEAVVRRVLEELRVEAGPVHIKRGKERLRARISAYNHAARLAPWVVLVDLDQETPCAPALVAKWLPEPSGGMCFRVAVHQVEAWLLGDREGIARFMRVDRSRVPPEPELLPDAKQVMIDLARLSTSREIQRQMVPARDSEARVGPVYTAMLIEFASGVWNPQRAAEVCPSLSRFLNAVRRCVEAQGD